jgi:hypothetical protein
MCFAVTGTSVSSGTLLNLPSVEIETRPCSEQKRSERNQLLIVAVRFNPKLEPVSFRFVPG